MSGHLQQEIENLEALADQQADIIANLGDIIEQLRVILSREDAGDREIVSQARIALSAWLAATYPHLYPSRPQLRVIEGGGEGTGRLF